MSILPLLPILILLGGALAIVCGRMVRFTHYDAIAAIASLLALGAMIPLVTSGLPTRLTLVSAWQPLSVFGAPVSLRVERLDWLIGFVAILACASTALAGVAYPGERRFGSRALALGMTAALVSAAFSANLLTLVWAWGLFDLLFAIAALMRSEGTQAGRRTAFAVGFNGAAIVCLWIAALALNRAHQSQYWHLTHPPETARDFLVLAAVLRLGLYPFSQWIPTERADAPGRVALLYVLPRLVGLHILIRVTGVNTLPQESTLSWLAALSILVGGMLAWWRADSRDALPYLALSGVGVVALSGIGGRTTSAPPSVLAAGAAGWALAIMTLSLSRGFDRRMPWWSIGHALALATLVGMPATLGFAVQTSLAANLATHVNGLLIAFTLIGQALTFGTLIRLTAAPAHNEMPSGRVAIGAYTAAIASAALASFLLPAIGRTAIPEVTPPSFEVVLTSLAATGSVLIALPIAMAIGLVWLWRDRPGALRFDLTHLVSLDWLYNLILHLAGLTIRSLRGLAMLVEGEGAVLWALLVLIAAYVVLSGAIR